MNSLPPLMGPKERLHFQLELERVLKHLEAGPGDGCKNFVELLKSESVHNLIAANLFTKLFVGHLR